MSKYRDQTSRSSEIRPAVAFLRHTPNPELAKPLNAENKFIAANTRA